MHYKSWGRMRKKLVFGIILVLALLLLMPSIPAIQQKIIEDEIKDKLLSELPEQLDFKDIKELIDFPPDDVKHPFLFIIVYIIFAIQLFHWGYLFLRIIYNPDNQLLLFRYQLNTIILGIYTYFWVYISNLLGWNWAEYIEF
jgi:hypothetical protein